MGYQCLIRCCKQFDQYALSHVVSPRPTFITTLTHSHASISAAVRKERGLPEDLIRLCVGIEDPQDLMDDLEHSLLSAGAIVHNLSYSPISQSRSEELYATRYWYCRSARRWGLEDSRSQAGREEAVGRRHCRCRAGQGYSFR
jgi:hypothetical protein